MNYVAVNLIFHDECAIALIFYLKVASIFICFRVFRKKSGSNFWKYKQKYFCFVQAKIFLFLEIQQNTSI